MVLSFGRTPLGEHERSFSSALEVPLKNTESSVPVYCHDKRPEWGLALLTWERGNKRCYLFEDGAQRIIAEPYYPLMKLSQVERTSLSDSFRQQISQMSLAKAKGLVDPAREASPCFTVSEQAQLLVGKFPEGFGGKAWQQHHRGDGAKKRLKRHRTAAITEARNVLDAQRVARAVTDHRHEELWRNICKLLRTTDLVPLRDVKALEQRLPWVTRGLTVALAGLLHSEPGETTNAFDTHFANFVSELRQVLGNTPSWPLATSLTALFFPDTQLCVHPSSLVQQCKWMGEKSIRSKKPNPLDYARARKVAQALFGQLEELGLKPADLLDVHDFIRTSTTPAAKQRLEALRQSDLRESAFHSRADHESVPASGTGERIEAPTDAANTTHEAA